MLQLVKITHAPSHDDPDEWVEGNFEVEEIGEDDGADQKTAQYNWKQLFIGKTQQKEIVGQLKNQAAIVDSGLFFRFLIFIG